MFSEEDWRAVVGIALSYLSRKWTLLPNAVRDHELSESAANLLVEEFPSAHALVRVLVSWLRNQPERDASILEFVLAFDLGLAPFNDTDLLAHFDAHGVDGIQMWRGKRGLLFSIDPGSDRKPTSQSNDVFTPPLASRLHWLRFVATHGGLPPVKVEDLAGDVAMHLHNMFEYGTLAKPLRVGLFSLRGQFMPSIEYTRAHSDWYGFHVGGISTGGYEEAIRQMVRAASDRDRGAHILILPEFMVTEEGRNVIKEALVEVARDENLQPPLLTIAGSRHMSFINEARGKERDVGNACEVHGCEHDPEHRPLWEQWKRERYGTQWPAKTAREQIKGFPLVDADSVNLREDIEPNGPTKIIRTAVGTIAIAICSDLMPGSASAPGTYLADAPVDWLVVPAFSDRTKPFTDRAYLLSRNWTATFFVNAWAAVEMAEQRKKKLQEKQSQEKPDEEKPKEEPLPPAQASADPNERVVASFVATPWSGYPVEFWKDERGIFQSSRPESRAFWMAIEVPGLADGLIVDLTRLLGALDADLTN